MSSLAVRVVPCLDVDAGRVVKGVRFADIRDAGDPVELAAEYNRQGADELVFYDITASAEGRDLILAVARRAAEQLFIPLSIGGGVRSAADIRRLLAAGADKVSVNSAAVARPDLIGEGAEAFGTQCIVLSIDCLRVPGRDPMRWEVVTAGGRNRTGRDVLEWAQEGERRGAGELVLNSIDADGTRAGYDLELTRTVADAVDIPVVASGGVGTLGHLVDGVTHGHASAVLAASIFHFGEHTIGDAKDALEKAGLTVRR